MAHATLSYSTQVFAADTLSAALAWAKRLGLSAVEVGKDHAERLHGSPEARVGARRTADELGIRLASLHAWTEVDGLPEVCPTAHDLGAGLIVVHCRDDRIEGEFDATVAALARWCDWCAERGVTLTVENSSRQRLEPFARLFRAVPALRMTLDVKHAYKPLLLGRTHVDYMRELGDRASNFHMLGIDPSRDDDLGDGIPAGHEPPGLSWRQLADDLADRRYDGLITAECSIHVPAERVEELYFDLAPPDGEARGLAHRLSRHNVRFFAGLFARVLSA